MSVLKTKDIDCDSRYIIKDDKIDLTTYEDKIALQNTLDNKIEILKQTHLKLKEFILENYSLEDML